MAQQDFTARELAYIRYKLIGDTYRDSWHYGDDRDAATLVSTCHTKLLKAIGDANAPAPSASKQQPPTRGDILMKSIREMC